MSIFDNPNSQRLIDLIMKLLSFYTGSKALGFAGTGKEQAEKAGKILDNLESCVAEVDRLTAENKALRR